MKAEPRTIIATAAMDHRDHDLRARKAQELGRAIDTKITEALLTAYAAATGVEVATVKEIQEPKQRTQCMDGSVIWTIGGAALLVTYPLKIRTDPGNWPDIILHAEVNYRMFPNADD